VQLAPSPALPGPWKYPVERPKCRLLLPIVGAVDQGRNPIVLKPKQRQGLRPAGKVTCVFHEDAASLPVVEPLRWIDLQRALDSYRSKQLRRHGRARKSPAQRNPHAGVSQ